MLKISDLTIQEKIMLLSGKSGDIVAQKYGRKYLNMSDGPHGVRSRGVCYPNMCLVSSSWDKELLYRMGSSIGNDCIAEGVDVLLGPGVNIKRTPLCGRNFEYFSEDALLAGLLGAAFVNGVQSKGVFACVKHFCCYNQEKNRFTQNVNVDEETLMNLYVRVFRIIIEQSAPAFLMASYNKVNGEFVSQSKKLITDILKKKLGYNGLVITDWGGVDFRHKGLAAGVDLNMPGDKGTSLDEVMGAYSRGEISAADIDRSVGMAIEAIEKAAKSKTLDVPDYDWLTTLAAESMVLLQNNNNALPLSPQDDIVVIGELAVNPRCQGGGCAEIASVQSDSPYGKLCDLMGRSVKFEQGYSIHSTDTLMVNDAIAAAENAGKVIYFMGLDASAESEAYDRESINLPASQVELLKQLYKANPSIIVVLTNGSAVDLSEVVPNSAAILECWYAGDAYADALVKVLSGEVNPCGRLAESFYDSKTIEALEYVDGNDSVRYSEGEMVGYKYGQHYGKKPVFAFGHGLSYTSFQYSDLQLSSSVTAGEPIDVTVKVSNSGNRGGKEVVQLYIRNKADNFVRLAAFDKIWLEPQQERTVTLKIESERLQRYQTSALDYVVQKGDYTVSVCTDCNTPVMEQTLTVTPRLICTRHTKIDDLRKIGNGPELISKYLSRYIAMASMGNPDYEIKFEGREIADTPFVKYVTYSMPLYLFTTLTAGMVNNTELDAIITKINEELVV